MIDLPDMNRRRRIITGHDEDGRSIVVEDAVAEPGNPVDVNVWRSFHIGADAPDAAFPFYPKDGETFCRFVYLPPDPDPLPVGAAAALTSEGFFAAAGIPECRVDTSRHPLAHQTPTTDIIIVLSSNISLILDEGPPLRLNPFDVVVQRATNHAWAVKGPEPGILISVMTGNFLQGQ